LRAAWNWIKDTASNVWDAIKQFFVDWWPFILGIFTGGIGLLVGLVIQNWDQIKQWTSNVWNNIKEFFSSTWNTIVSLVRTAASNVWNSIRDALNNALVTVTGWVGNIISFFRALPGNILDGLGNLGSLLVGVARNMMEGFLNGVKAVAGRIKDAVLGPIKDSVNAVKNFLGIASPSKLTYSIGDDTGQGFVNALRSKASEVREAMEVMASGGAPLTAGSSPMGSAAAEALGGGAAAGPLIPGPTGPSGGQTIVYNIDKVEVPIQASLDPTNAAQWRQAMGAIKQGIRDHDRSYQ